MVEWELRVVCEFLGFFFPIMLLLEVVEFNEAGVCGEVMQGLAFERR